MHTAFWFFVFRRVALGVPLVLAIVVITFLLIRIAPGDPVALLAGDAPTPEFVREVRERYALDRSLPEQLGLYLANAVRGDFGTSIHYGRAVTLVIVERLPATLLLAFATIILASVAGLTLGVLAARYRGGMADSLVTSVSLVGYSVPVFWLGQLLVLVLALRLGWLPTSGMRDVREQYTGFEAILDVARHMVLPVLSLTLFEMGLIARFTRTAMVEALDNEYVTVAYAKGLSERQVLLRHALPNAMVATLTIIGLQFGSILAGAVVTETIYAWPGIGRLLLDAVLRRDFPLLSGIFAFASIAVILVNLATDLAYALIDPRVYRK